MQTKPISRTLVMAGAIMFIATLLFVSFLGLVVIGRDRSLEAAR